MTLRVFFYINEGLLRVSRVTGLLLLTVGLWCLGDTTAQTLTNCLKRVTPMSATKFHPQLLVWPPSGRQQTTYSCSHNTATIIPGSSECSKLLWYGEILCRNHRSTWF